MAQSQVAQDLSSLDRDLVKFRGCVQCIGTPLDNSDNQREVRRLRLEIKKKIGDANVKLQHQQRGTPQQRVEARQLSKQLADHIQRFEKLLDQEKNLARQRSESATLSTDGADVPMIHYQAQTQTAAVAEREREAEDLGELERDILDLHEIQQDLAGMVVEQGEDVGHIESNVSRAAVRVEKGKRRLDDAVTLKRKSRWLKLCIFLLIAIPILIILVIAIILMAVFIPKDN